MTARVPGLGVFLVGLMGMTGAAWAAGPCPTVGHSTFQGDNQAYLTAGGGCNVVVTVSSSGTAVSVVNSSPFDGSDDTLVGVVNNGSTPLTTLTFSGSGISGWDGDGICVFGAGGIAGDTFTTGSSSYCTAGQLAGNDPGDYYGPGMTFTNDSTGDAVTINFSPAIAPGGTTFFSLEEPPSSSLAVSGGGSPPPSTPAPSSLYLAAIGVVAFSLYVAKRRFAQA